MSHQPDWYPTLSGADIYLTDPWRSVVRIEDIAHALALQTRYGGHVRSHYSVAQHCVLMSRLAIPENALAALLHDAAEAYCQDIIGPLKRLLAPLYEPLERVWLERISVEFGVDLVDLPAEVKLLDKQMLVAEMRDITNDGRLYPGVEPAPVTIYPWAQETARRNYLLRFYDLTKPVAERVQIGHPAVT